jgi:hypothetical protein
MASRPSRDFRSRSTNTPFRLAEPNLKRGGRNDIADFRIDGEAFVIDYGRLTRGR